jgi:hypothetical protein
MGVKSCDGVKTSAGTLYSVQVLHGIPHHHHSDLTDSFGIDSSA